MTSLRRWAAGIPIGLALVLAIDMGLSILVGSARVSRLLTARLEATFGRPVKVGGYTFSLWGGPEIEASSVVVGEDPRFGNEYFLRAGELSATLRLSSLLLGRVELGSFSISDASLNVVTAGGEWNLADWLPAPAAGQARGNAGAPRLYRIDIDHGRINFERGTVKLPFALVDVKGSVDETAPGRWSLSLDAQPLRAAVTLQDAGTLHLAGQVGGTSARLRPASLHLRWEDASISDVLRLFFGYDYGIRGHQDMDLQASSSGGDWQFELDSRDAGLHRWDLPPHENNPGVNARIKGSWSPGKGEIRVTSGQIEGPASTVAVRGNLNWPVAGPAKAGTGEAVPQLQIQLSSKGVGAEDLLSWYRSFHQPVPASLRATGWIEGSAEVAGWPARLDQASMETGGLRVEGGSLPGPISTGDGTVVLSQKKATLSLADLDFGRARGMFEVTGSARYRNHWAYRVDASGNSPEIGDLVDSAEALGVHAPPYWKEFSGSATIGVVWTGTIPFSQSSVLASIGLKDAVWQEPSLPARVILKNASVKASGDGLRFDVRSAEALGASWHGWLERRNPAAAWQFALTADRIDARNLFAKLRPREQHPSLLERIFGFGHAAGSPPLWPAALDASGTLAVNQVSIAPVTLGRLKGRVAIHAGELELAPAQARLYGGRAGGSFFFSVKKGVPVWRLGTRLTGIDLEELSRVFHGNEGRFSGLASGRVELSALGATAHALLDSLRGQATLSALEVQDDRIDWLATLESGHAVPGRSQFQRCNVQLQVAGDRVTLKDLSAETPRGRLEASGEVDLSRGAIMAVQARFFPAPGIPASGLGVDARTYRVTGSPIDPLVQFLAVPEDPKSQFQNH